MSDETLAYQTAKGLEKAVWLYALQFTHDPGDWQARLNDRLRAEWRPVMIALAKARRRFPGLPICMLFHQILDEVEASLPPRCLVGR